MSDELRECPFCGYKAPRLSLDTRSKQDEWYIWCVCGMATRAYRDDTAAVAAWNRRAPATGGVPPEVREAIRRALLAQWDNERWRGGDSQPEIDAALAWLDAQAKHGQE